jgi:hypothetical protein
LQFLDLPCVTRDSEYTLGLQILGKEFNSVKDELWRGSFGFTERRLASDDILEAASKDFMRLSIVGKLIPDVEDTKVKLTGFAN